MTIDLNADLGEGCADDDALMQVIASANIACGGHAGDDATMLATIRSAQRHGVTIGAHPSYPDREGFGRAPMHRLPEEIERDVIEQVAALDRCARACGASLRHVKAHGALYNTAARDAGVADAISRAVLTFDARLAVVGLAGGAQIASARKHGLRAIEEVFADRRYLPGGMLVPRSQPNALIDDEEEAAAQALAFVRERRGQTICVHGDTPRALDFAHAIRRVLQSAGIAIASFATE